jgi:hypothetical protein
MWRYFSDIAHLANATAAETTCTKASDAAATGAPERSHVLQRSSFDPCDRVTVTVFQVV